MNASCPLCGATAAFYFQTKDLNRKISDRFFDYYLCGGCGFVYLQCAPENLFDYYPPDYSILPKTWLQYENWTVQEKYKLDIVQKFISHGRMLEIGPSNGVFSHLAKKAGFDVSCIEMDSRCCRFIQDELSIPVVKSSDPVAVLGVLGIFDVIVLWQAIEHFKDPFQILSACSQKLTSGGWLILSAPNVDSHQFRIFKRYWTHVDAPRHLSLMPPGLLRAQCEKSGLVCVDFFSDDPGGRGWNLFGWQFSLINVFQQPFFKKAVFFFGRIFCSLFYYFEGQSLRGSSYTAIFRKTGGD